VKKKSHEGYRYYKKKTLRRKKIKTHRRRGGTNTSNRKQSIDTRNFDTTVYGEQRGEKG